MEFGNDQPPIFCSTDILRKAKQDVVDSNLGIQGSDPVLSLIELKHGSEHNGSIHTISIDKTFVHFWSPMQCHMFKDHKTKVGDNFSGCNGFINTIRINLFIH